MNILWLIPIVVVLTGIIVLILQINKFGKREPMWDSQIRKFREENQLTLREGGIVFTGSSSIRRWDNLQEDMAPLQVINRGLGGGRIFEVTHYFDDLILPHDPKGIVFYAGENDLSDFFWVSAVSTPEDTLEDFKEFYNKVEEHFPGLPVFYISIKPPKRRLKNWQAMENSNTLLEAFCEKYDNLHYIDVVDAMTDDKGVILEDISAWDGIHLNEDGYQIWIDVIKPVLLDYFN